MAELDFTGKVAIVTGASRGIGRVIALGLAHRGATVVGTARQMDSSPGTGGTLRETFDMIEAAGGKGMAIAGSITESGEVNDLVAHVERELGRIDILVNNAGYHPGVSITEMTDEQWRAMMEINVDAVFFMTRAVVPIMKKQHSGNIVGVSSGAGTRNFRGDNTGYGGTKGFMDRCFLNLAAELKEHGIAVNAWAPGILATDMNKSRGMPGQPPEVVEPSIMWLCAQTVDTFTGQIVRREDFGELWGPKA